MLTRIRRCCVFGWGGGGQGEGVDPVDNKDTGLD